LIHTSVDEEEKREKGAGPTQFSLPFAITLSREKKKEKGKEEVRAFVCFGGSRGKGFRCTATPARQN